MKQLHKIHRQQGISILEIVLATALFFIFSATAVVSLLQGLDASRLGIEHTVATQYAAEAIDAVRSIKNQNFLNLVDTDSTGLVRNNLNIWQFQGSNNIFDNGKEYTRTVRISPVNRDIEGNIVPAPTGFIDSITKKTVVTVNWDFNIARKESIDLTTYLTDWEKPINHGLIIYGDSTDIPKFRTYNFLNDNFEEENITIVGSTGQVFRLRTSPIKQEAIAAYSDSTGKLQVMCYNGTNWNNEWSTIIGGNGSTGNFDIAYENNSGDALVVYSKEKQGSNAINYQTKSGSNGCGNTNWSSVSTLLQSPRLTNGTVRWIRAESNPVIGSNNISIAWSDNNSRLGAAVWGGNSWVNLPETTLETKLERIKDDGDVLSFDLSYENQSGNLLIVWGVLTTNKACNPDSNCIKFSRFDGSRWSTGPVTNVAASATNIDLSANPASNEIIMAAIDNGPNDTNLNRLSVGYWSGSNWTGNAVNSDDVSPPLPGTKLVATGWLSNQAVVVYNKNNSNSIN